MAKSSQISTTNRQTPNNTSTSKAITPKTVKKPIPYTFARRIHTIIKDKNKKKPKNLALKNYTQSYIRENTQQH